MMLEILQFYVSGFWIWLGITIALETMLRPPVVMFNRYLRSRNIAAHGWPKNPLMDADGDIVHPKAGAA